MTNLTQDQLATLIAQVVGQVLAGQTATPKATSKPQFLPKGGKAAPSDLASKDQHLINAFHRKGFKDVQLMDRTDPTKPFNVKPFKAWLDQGRIVRKGQRGIKGLFHVTQTDLLPGKASSLCQRSLPLVLSLAAPSWNQGHRGHPFGCVDHLSKGPTTRRCLCWWQRNCGRCSCS